MSHSRFISGGLLFVACLILPAKLSAATHTVRFMDKSFSPATLMVNIGDTVTFENAGGFHTVTGTGSDPFCGTEQVATSCAVTFRQAGVFPYRCLFHSQEGPPPTGMTGSITVTGNAEKPNIVPFHLNGWTSPVVVSRAPGTNISDPDFYDDQDIFLDWAIANTSLTAGIAPRFFTELLVDGTFNNSWFHDGLAPDTFNKIEDFNLGKLPVGDHTFTLITDHTAVVDESNEDDNSYETRVRIIPSIARKHTVLVSNFMFTPWSLTIRKGDTVDFRVTEGSHTATGIGPDPFCGTGAIPGNCSVTFNSTGQFPYRCMFHSSGGATLQGMLGQVRVVDEIILEKATKVTGPFSPAPDAKIDYSGQTVTFGVPSATAFWRLNSAAALQIKRTEVKPPNVVLTFE